MGDVDRFSLSKLDNRIKDCIKTNGKILDLSRLKLKKIDISLIPANIEMLFLSYNNLRVIPNLDKFKKLEVLDVSFNKLRELPKLPKYLEELGCNNNLIKSIEIEHLKIKRLNCSSNFLKNINFRGEILDCSFNKIENLNITDKLIKLYCRDNKLFKIPKSKNLENLICSENKLMSIPKSDKIHNLVCDNNRITYLPELPNLDFLHCHDNKLDKIVFFPKLKEMVCDKKVKISKKYKILEKITITHPDNDYVKMRFDTDLKNNTTNIH